MNSRKHGRPAGSTGAGLTLIELMVALAILAIVMAIAIPMYTNYVTRSNRADATEALSRAAQELQRCHTLHGRFDHDDCNVSFPFTSENGHYEISASIGRNSYSLTATPQGTQATRDSDCGRFLLDQAGVRSVSGSAAAEECW